MMETSLKKVAMGTGEREKFKKNTVVKDNGVKEVLVWSEKIKEPGTTPQFLA